MDPKFIDEELKKENETLKAENEALKEQQQLMQQAIDELIFGGVL